ncbi:MAG TPA: hypothetical protein VJX67_26715, partial [Blastocatellia bacterium]|nr:hypothetical protein [Blastocatellia bacterium]
KLEYQTSFASGIHPYSYTVTFGDITAHSFKRHQESSNGLQLDSTWQCQSDGLAAMQYGDLSMPETRLKLDTQRAGGVTLPSAAKWQKGAKWSNSYEVTGQMSLGGPRPVDVQGTISVANEIVAEETVTVPAGTYDAFKVVSTITQDLSLRNTRAAPIRMSFGSSSWYVKDVGMVKALSQDLKSTTVLSAVAAGDEAVTGFPVK